MEKTHFDRNKAIIAATKKKIEEEIKEIDTQGMEAHKREKKLSRYLGEKQSEIVETKSKILLLAKIEDQSKGQIDQHIEMLTWLIDTIEDTVDELKNKMVDNSEAAIIESSKDLEYYIQDLEEIMTPLSECKSITDKTELKQTIIGIAETLKLFSENIEDTIYSMTTLIQKANADAVEESSNEFDAFIKDIHQIFDTFNNVLQQLKITNSVKKYLELEDIYIEINRILDDLSKLKKNNKVSLVKKELKEEELSQILSHGMNKDLSSLRTRKIAQQKKYDKIREELQGEEFKFEDISDKLEFIELEKTTLREWFQALNDEVVDKQNEATDTYNVMYATLDNINSTMSFIKSDLKNSSEMAINSIIREFTKNALTFGRMVGIIKKVESVSNQDKMKNSIELISKKSKAYIKKIKTIVKTMANHVRKANQEAIDESFGEFDEFVKEFKENFFIIQDAVKAITLSSSDQLINDLQKISDKHIETRQIYMEKDMEVYSLRNYVEFTKSHLQGIENELKIYSKSDRKRRKVLKIRKTIEKPSESGPELVKWKVENGGVVSFNDVIINDIAASNFQITNSSKPLKTKKTPIGNIYRLNVETLTKREFIEFDYEIENSYKIKPEFKSKIKNISRFKLFRYRNSAQPVSLKIVENNGNGAIIIKNMGKKDLIWDIFLEFTPTKEIKNVPNVFISHLKPQQEYIQKYSYKTPRSLKPLNFHASTKHSIGVNETRSTQEENLYKCEFFIENNSEFLIYINSLQIYNAGEFDTPIIEEDPIKLDAIRPHFDVRKEYDVETELDPPQILINMEYTLHLVYEFDENHKIDINKLQETPELSIKGGRKARKSLKQFAVEISDSSAVSKTPELKGIHPDLSRINQEISQIEEEIKDTEQKLQNLRDSCETKQSEKELIVKRIEKEKREEELLEKKRQAEIIREAQQRKEEEEYLRQEQLRITKEQEELAKKQEELAKKQRELKKKSEERSKAKKQEELAKKQRELKKKSEEKSKAKKLAKKTVKKAVKKTVKKTAKLEKKAAPPIKKPSKKTVKRTAGKKAAPPIKKPTKKSVAKKTTKKKTSVKVVKKKEIAWVKKPAKKSVAKKTAKKKPSAKVAKKTVKKPVKKSRSLDKILKKTKKKTSVKSGKKEVAAAKKPVKKKTTKKTEKKSKKKKNTKKKKPAPKVSLDDLKAFQNI
jgi:hypothetical protein